MPRSGGIEWTRLAEREGDLDALRRPRWPATGYGESRRRRRDARQFGAVFYWPLTKHRKDDRNAHGGERVGRAGEDDWPPLGARKERDDFGFEKFEGFRKRGSRQFGRFQWLDSADKSVT